MSRCLLAIFLVLDLCGIVFLPAAPPRDPALPPPSMFDLVSRKTSATTGSRDRAR
ncbi:MAG: hypothetical protein QM811_00940 [Pirellulales bacterium]